MPKIFAHNSRRLVAIMTALVIALQSVLPGGFFGANRALAASQIYDFSDSGDYSAGANASIHNGTGHFLLTWADRTSSGFGGSGSFKDIYSPESEGRVWAAVSDGDGDMYISTDGGATWSADSIAGFDADKFIEPTGDASENLIVSGDLSAGGNLVAYYSTDYGDTWTVGTFDFAVPVSRGIDLTHDSADNHTWMLADNGISVRSTDGGVNWSSQGAVGLTVGRGIEWITANTIVATGSDGGTPRVVFSTDSGAAWSDASLPGSPSDTVGEIVVNNGFIYVSGQDYLARIAVGADMAVVGNWTEITANVNGGQWDNGLRMLSANGILFVGVSDSGNTKGKIYSTIDNGSNWLDHGAPWGSNVAGLSKFTRLYGTGEFLAVRESADVYIGEAYDADAGIVTLDGLTLAEINSITHAMHARSEHSEISLAFGFDTDPAGTWYYYSGGNWLSGAGDNLTFSTGISTLTEGVLQTFDDQVTISGVLYTKIYLAGGTPDNPDKPLSILDTLTIDYDPATITVTAPDGGESWTVGTQQTISWTSTGGLATVDLEYSINAGSSWSSIAAGEANDGSYLWTVPNDPSVESRVRISSGAITDSSNADFRIVLGGQGGANDDIDDDQPPYSDVDDLPSGTNTSPLKVTVTAYDDTSGLESVRLYYTVGLPAITSGELIPFGEPKHGCPEECFEWEFTFPAGEGRYYFYSSAIDFAGNDNFDDKFPDTCILALPPGLECQDLSEANTIFDMTAPYVVGSRPKHGDKFVAISGVIELRMSESMALEGFDYNLFYYQNGQKISDKNKLGDPIFPPSGDGCPPWLICDQEYGYPTLTIQIPYSGLRANTEYHFTIRHLYDLGGNDVLKNSIEQPENIEVWRLTFKTMAVSAPDLSSSTLNIDTDKKYGFFNAGDVVPFLLTLRNTSPVPAQIATAELTIANGLTYCDTPQDTGHCAPATSEFGTIMISNEGGQTRISWTGAVTEGTEVGIRFWATVNDPASLPIITQFVTIDDGINPAFDRYDHVYILAESSLGGSSKTGVCYIDGSLKTCTQGYVGALVEYTVRAVNSGSTPANLLVTDALPSTLGFVPGTLQGELWDSLIYDESTRTITAQAILPPGSTFSFSFAAEILPGASGSVTNTAIVQDQALGGGMTVVSFTTRLDGDFEQDKQPPQIAFLSPTPNQKAVSLKSKIEIGFTKSMDTASFGFALKLGGELVDISGWQISWSERNGLPNALVQLTPPSDFRFEIDADYVAEVLPQTKDLAGNVLAPGPYDNPWQFTTVAPGLRIVEPEIPILQVGVNEVSPVMVVQALDINLGTPYPVEEDVQVGVLAEIPTTGVGGFKRQISATTLFGTNPQGNGFRPSTLTDIFHITIPAGQSRAEFYLKDSVKNILTVTAFPDPYIGWSAGQKTVWILDKEDINTGTSRLEFVMQNDSVKPGVFSKPIEVHAISQNDTQLLLPDTLYFHTESPTGAFYDENFERLPDMITTAALNPTTNLQFAAGLSGISATFYYLDSTVGTYLVTASDNAPLQPDIDLANAHAILSVVANELIEEEILEELEEVEDDTGRMLDKLVIEPEQTVMLPGDVKKFKVTAYDTEGEVIENARFKWYVVAGGGTIEKDGTDGASSQTEFVAGQDLGIFYDTVLVATLYNGQFGFATASVQVTDIVGYVGDVLPTTGINLLQIIFMALTLVAAVALAWVEHYDKTRATLVHEKSNPPAAA